VANDIYELLKPALEVMLQVQNAMLNPAGTIADSLVGLLGVERERNNREIGKQNDDAASAFWQDLANAVNQPLARPGRQGQVQGAPQRPRIVQP
jgi:hypothetical protein